MFPPSKRKGRPLLAAAAGIAFVSFAASCREHRPVGNLRAPDPVPGVGDPTPTAGTTQTGGTDPGTAAAGGSAPLEPTPIPPVGNLRVPTDADPPPLEPKPEPKPDPKPEPKPVLKPEPKPHHPVGNLRPPE